MKQTLLSMMRSVGPLHRGINRMRALRLHEPTARIADMAIIGSDYGGWAVSPRALGPASIVYGVGVGKDISFDLGMIARFGCTVHAFDPTPVSAAWIATQALPAEFRYHAVGLGAEDGEATFHAPVVDGHASFSLTGDGDGGATRTVTCPIRRLATLMEELGHRHLDLLKMDIEGFEYAVIDDMIAGGIRPMQLLIEFHHGMYKHVRADTDAAVAAIMAYGYDIFWVSNGGHEYGFIARTG